MRSSEPERRRILKKYLRALPRGSSLGLAGDVQFFADLELCVIVFVSETAQILYQLHVRHGNTSEYKKNI